MFTQPLSRSVHREMAQVNDIEAQIAQTRKENDQLSRAICEEKVRGNEAASVLRERRLRETKRAEMAQARVRELEAELAMRQAKQGREQEPEVSECLLTWRRGDGSRSNMKVLVLFACPWHSMKAYRTVIMLDV